MNRDVRLLLVSLLGLVVMPATAAETQGLLYQPVAPCVLVRTVASSQGALGPNEARAFVARGPASLSLQGGARAGCGIPIEAAALAVTLRALGAGPGQLKVWAADQAEPPTFLADYDESKAGPTVSALIELCATEPCDGDFQAMTTQQPAHLRIDVVGYFVAARAATADRDASSDPRASTGPSDVLGPPAREGSDSSRAEPGPDSLTIDCTDAATAKASNAPRKFFLTKQRFDGDQALTACGPGYRMAGLYEILDPTALRYNSNLGNVEDDSGSGPPTATHGWVRTGFRGSTSSAAGQGNCLLWRSENPADDGTIVALSSSWLGLITPVSPWEARTRPCNEIHHVWCVQN